MTYLYQTNGQAARYRYQYQTTSAPRPRALPRKVARLLIAKRVLHFIGFLCFWAVALSVAFLAMLVALAVCFFLA